MEIKKHKQVDDVSIAPAMARHELWTLVVKPLGITMKKAVERKSKQKN
jgi:hypothetical protein